MRSRHRQDSAIPATLASFGVVCFLLAISTLVAPTHAYAALDRPHFYFEVRDFIGFVTPKLNGEIPVGADSVSIGPSLISEVIPGNTTQIMIYREGLYPVQTQLSTNTEVLGDGTTRWRWEILSSLPTSPNAVGDTFLQVFEIFDQATSTTLYGGVSNTSVRDDTVYYSQVVNASQWSISPAATDLRFVTWAIFNTDAPGSELISSSTSSILSRDISATQFTAHISLSKTMIVDGVLVSTSASDFVTDAEQLIYATNQQVTIPTSYAVQSFELLVVPAAGARLSPKPKYGLHGYQKSTIAVGVVLGVPALVAVIAFATWLFCLGTWLSIWAVISIPGRAVLRRIKLCFRPPAPTFELEEDEDEEEDDPLDMERVDSEQLLKFASGHTVSSSLKHHRNDSGSTDNVLSRLRKAMGRRLSNFVGWDGPPPGSSSAPGSPGSDRSPSPKHKKKNRPVKGASGPPSSSSIAAPNFEDTRIISEDALPGLQELEGSSGNNVMMASIYSAKTSGGDAEASVRLLSDRDESPSRGGHRRDLSAGSSSDASGSRSDRDEPPRVRKPAGLRGFKITNSTSSPTIDVPSPAPSQTATTSPENDTVDSIPSAQNTGSEGGDADADAEDQSLI